MDEKVIQWLKDSFPLAITADVPEENGGGFLSCKFTDFYNMYGEELSAAIAEGKTGADLIQVISDVDAIHNYGWSYYIHN